MNRLTDIRGQDLTAVVDDVNTAYIFHAGTKDVKVGRWHVTEFGYEQRKIEITATDGKRTVIFMHRN